MEEVGSFRLRNDGWFVARLEFVYINEAGNRVRVGGSGDITLGRSATVDPGLHGVPDGARVTLYAVVVSGNDRESDIVFIYRRGLLRTADFTISGTTLNSQLRYNGIVYPPGVGGGGETACPPAAVCCCNIITCAPVRTCCRNIITCAPVRTCCRNGGPLPLANIY